MQYDTIANVMQSGIAICLVLLIAKYALTPTLCDVFRQRVFRLRRLLLLMRIDGLVEPNDRAYLILYRMMNGVIGNAEHMTFGRLLLFSAMPVPHELINNESVDLFEEAASSSPEPVRRRLAQLRIDLGYEIVRHVVMTSPLAWGILVVVVPIAPVLKMINVVRRGFRRLARSLASLPSIMRLESNAVDMLAEDSVDVAAALVQSQ
jgi:hypothetical protein